MIEAIIGENFVDYLYKEIYQPIGARHLVYHPHLHYAKEQIVPTERDTFFRNQLVHGSVHDEAAAMLDGVSCNAGLFGNAALQNCFKCICIMGDIKTYKSLIL